MKTPRFGLSNKHRKSLRKRTLLTWLAVIAGTLLISVIATLAYFTYLSYAAVSELSTVRIGSLILEASDRAASPMVVDSKTGAFSIPVAKISIPAEPGTQTPRYTVFDAGMPTQTIHIVAEPCYQAARTKVLNSTNIDTLFAEVPTLQACLRGYALTFDRTDNTLGTLQTTKTLKDGRILRIYADPACSNTSIVTKQLLDTIESY